MNGGILNFGFLEETENSYSASRRLVSFSFFRKLIKRKNNPVDPVKKYKYKIESIHHISV
jgi:hypothetical protein